LPDSKPKEFFCNGCQRYKKGELLAYRKGNQCRCTACALPEEEREKMGITNLYENTTRQNATNVQATKAYKKPISVAKLRAITGEHNGST